MGRTEYGINSMSNPNSLVSKKKSNVQIKYPKSLDFGLALLCSLFSWDAFTDYFISSSLLLLVTMLIQFLLEMNAPGCSGFCCFPSTLTNKKLLKQPTRILQPLLCQP